ncbi:MAG: hypothetical protein ABGX23_01885 [Nautiliaceae bacterium]
MVRSFTLFELIISIVISMLFFMGVLVVVSKIYKRDYFMIKSYEFESKSEIILSKISNYLYYRVPFSVIGYNPVTKNYKYIGEINNNSYPVLEWVGEFFDAKKELNLSGFIDLYASKKPIIKAIDFNADFINEILKNKYQKINIKRIRI